MFSMRGLHGEPPGMDASTPLHVRSPELLDRTRSRVLIVDMQERLLAAIPDGAQVTANAHWLCQAARLFEVPIDVTEQYPQGLGPTSDRLRDFAIEPPAKTIFSAVPAIGYPGASSSTELRDQVVLAGVEAHVCVLQTAFDLLALGYRVFVAADAVASRRSSDRETALQRLRDSGALLTTVESAAFEWCVDARDPQFKALSALAKHRV